MRTNALGSFDCTRPSTPADVLRRVLGIELVHGTERGCRCGARFVDGLCEFFEILAARRFPLASHLTYGPCVALVGAYVYSTKPIAFVFIWVGLESNGADDITEPFGG